jgi:hypothetical protein
VVCGGSAADGVLIQGGWGVLQEGAGLLIPDRGDLPVVAANGVGEPLDGGESSPRGGKAEVGVGFDEEQR